MASGSHTLAVRPVEQGKPGRSDHVAKGPVLDAEQPQMMSDDRITHV